MRHKYGASVFSVCVFCLSGVAALFLDFFLFCYHCFIVKLYGTTLWNMRWPIGIGIVHLFRP